MALNKRLQAEKNMQDKEDYYADVYGPGAKRGNRIDVNRQQKIEDAQDKRVAAARNRKKKKQIQKQKEKENYYDNALGSSSTKMGPEKKKTAKDSSFARNLRNSW